MTSFSAAGAFTALVTPFTADGSTIDFAAYEALVEEQIKSGIAGLVPCGTTGEAPTLSDREQVELVKTTVRVAAGRTGVLAGVGSNATTKVVALAKAAEEAGADAVMAVMPYYNKPNQEGLFQHVKAVATAVGVPVVLYNVPGRTVVSLSVETTLRILDQCPNVIAVKDASNNVHYCQDLLSRAGTRVSVFSGDDGLTVPLMALGARGVISVTSNVLPRAVATVVGAMLAGRSPEALALHYALLSVHCAMFLAPSPVPAKTVLAERGKMLAGVRLPLVPATLQEKQEILSAVAQFEAQNPGVS